MGARDLPRALSAALWIALAGAPALALQDRVPETGPEMGPGRVPGGSQEAGPRARLERHLRGVYLERRLDFERRWGSAGEEARERARAVLDALPGEAAFTPSARVLARAGRALVGEVETDDARLVESIDLRTLPGAFEPTDRARGEPLVVVVRGLYPLELEASGPEATDAGELALFWLGPDGAQVRAGGETFHPRALVAGFEVYLHAPASRPGTWGLEPRIGAARGHAVPVECIADVRSLYAAHTAREPAPPRRSPLAEAFEHGIRPPSGASIASMLAGAEPGLLGRVLRDDAGAIVGYELDAPAGMHEGAPAGGVLLLHAPRYEDPEWSFAGERGEAWRALGREVGLRVIATATPTSAAEHLPRGRKTLVVRAPGATRTPEGAFERRVVLMRAGTGAALDAHERPLLVIELGCDEEGVMGPEEGRTTVQLTEPAALADVVVPPWIARWMAGALDRAPGEDR